MIDSDVLSNENYENGSNTVDDEELKLFDDIVGFLESLLGKLKSIRPNVETNSHIFLHNKAMDDVVRHSPHFFHDDFVSYRKWMIRLQTCKQIIVESIAVRYITRNKFHG